MTWGHALPVGVQGATVSASPACFPHKHHAATCGHVQNTAPKQRHDENGRLILSLPMQREALILDHAAALKRRDMQALHRIEASLRSVTNRILAKGAYFETRRKNGQKPI